jgi:hypothetical protein
MEKFQINLNNLKTQVLLECILQKSKVVVEYVDIKSFYTHNNEPIDWWHNYIHDIKTSEKQIYKNQTFYIVWGSENRVCFVFYNECVYSFDEYYCDCPIFERILLD